MSVLSGQVQCTRNSRKEQFTMTQIGKSWIESLWGFVGIIGALATPFLRSRRLRWGTIDQKIETIYPGDDLVPDPKWTSN